MLRVLVALICGVAAFGLVYPLALLQTKQRRDFEQRKRAFFGNTPELAASRRTKNGKERTRLRRLDQIADELYVAGIALRA